MSDLAAFLLERIADDETAAQEAQTDALVFSSVPPYAKLGFSAGDLARRHDPARVLRQCAALRVVVEEHEESQGGDCLRCVEDWASDDRAPWPCPTLRALASIWSDHPNYREEWAL